MISGHACSSTAPHSSYVNWKQWRENEFGECSLLEAAFFDAEIGPFLGGRGEPKVLELGFGNGQFLGWCRARIPPIHYVGVEIDPEMCGRARSVGVTAKESIFDPELNAMHGMFDVVAAFDVIEHIEQSQLGLVFARVESLLTTGGHFVAKFPNGDSPFGRINQHGDLTHVTTLGRGKLEHLASMSRLQLVSFADPKRPWRRVGARNAARRLMGGLVKRLLEDVVRALYFDGQRISFDRNSVAILKKNR